MKTDNKEKISESRGMLKAEITRRQNDLERLLSSLLLRGEPLESMYVSEFENIVRENSDVFMEIPPEKMNFLRWLYIRNLWGDGLVSLGGVENLAFNKMLKMVVNCLEATLRNNVKTISHAQLEFALIELCGFAKTKARDIKYRRACKLLLVELKSIEENGQNRKVLSELYDCLSGMIKSLNIGIRELAPLAFQLSGHEKNSACSRMIAKYFLLDESLSLSELKPNQLRKTLSYSAFIYLDGRHENKYAIIDILFSDSVRTKEAVRKELERTCKNAGFPALARFWHSVYAIASLELSELQKLVLYVDRLWTENLQEPCLESQENCPGFFVSEEQVGRTFDLKHVAESFIKNPTFSKELLLTSLLPPFLQDVICDSSFIGKK